jgi:hypothetical protein
LKKTANFFAENWQKSPKIKKTPKIGKNRRKLAKSPKIGKNRRKL